MSETDPKSFAEHYALRDDELLEALRADLLGPAGGESELLTEDAPFAVYPVGVLFPQAGTPAAQDAVAEQAAEQDGLDTAAMTRHEDAAEDAGVDLGVALANLRRPSSMGLTFAVDPTACGGIVTARGRAAMYLPEDENGLRVAPRFSEARSTERQRERWRRVPLTVEPRIIDVTRPGYIEPLEVYPGLELRVLVRRPVGPQNVVAVTITLVNTLRVREGDLQDAFSFFQPELEITSATQDDGSLPFVERPAVGGAVDPELALSRLLHRHAPSFAVGHGCAAAWEWAPAPIGARQPQRAAVASVRSTFVPHLEVLLTDSNPQIDDGALTMHGLAKLSSEEIQEALRGLLDGYERWIEAREVQARELAGTEHATTAKTQLELCREALGRMRRGVALLADERRPHVLHAFHLANKAMAQQRARTSWVKDGRVGEPVVTSGKWRPFQISFLLLCLEGIVDPGSDDRGTADLLWFPTGGGKTEAYLGLIAFTAFHRRLRDGAQGGGVTVLMRYTLRLLTLQQFERAATLICAMEEIRREQPSTLGHERMSIGMWVGKSATPNKLDRAEKRLKELRKEPAKQLETENPIQLHACPWCGTGLDVRAYNVSGKRMTVHCPDPECAFHDEGLPVHLVDEALYDARPTLVIATVDKFASMPWRPETAALFNRDESVDGVRPPELIVQDELHLISGPLGTLTGLYETAVDVLADRPKVIASTATIRRAAQQGGALFDRGVAQFPPAGLDSRDSWFAVEAPRERKATRRYVGLLTPNTSQATLLIRTYAALLNRAASSEARPEVRDAYWTLVGYFNSLRLLAAAELQVLDDVADRLEYLARRDGADGPRRVEELVELTSRKTAGEIPRILKNLERGLPAEHVADVLLATNMIAVGVDIDRLGLMAVMGQPQTTAEYIQATSRVGRRHPGLIAVMLNSARSRDRSHYESFQHFHSALYREVESTSVTPFSARARDRGLHAVIVALTRILIPAARPNSAAGEIKGFIEEIDRLVRPRVLDRVGAVDRALDVQEYEATERAFDEFLEDWQYLAEENTSLVYEGKGGALLHGFIDDEADPDAWRTLWSLRDVDVESPFFLDK